MRRERGELHNAAHAEQPSRFTRGLHEVRNGWLMGILRILAPLRAVRTFYEHLKATERKMKVVRNRQRSILTLLKIPSGCRHYGNPN